MSDKPINSLPPTVNPVSEKKSDTIVSPNKLVNQQTTRGLINEPSLAPNKVINSNTKVGPINESLLTPNKVLNRTTSDNSDVKLPNTVNVTKTPAPNKSRAKLANTNGEIIGNGQEVISTSNGCVVVRTDKNVYVNVTENLIEQNYIKNSGEGSLCVGSVNAGNVYTNVVSNVQKLAFDDDSGFAVCNLGNGTAKIAMNSTFKYWEVNGSSGLTACGLDTVNFVAGSGVTITSDNTAVPKSLTISATGTSGVASLNSLTGSLTLSAGNNISIGSSGNTLTICSSGGTVSSATPTSLGTIYANTTSSPCNTYIGYCAGNMITTGDGNVAIGYGSLPVNTGGFSNVAVGINNLYCNTTGFYNTSIGAYSLQKNTYGFSNVAVGSYGLIANTSGCGNVAIGAFALTGNTIGNYNISIGAYGMTSNTSGGHNISIGGGLTFNKTGSNNIAIGCGALTQSQVDNNIAIGAGAGCFICTGANNTIIGSLTGSAGLVCTVLIGAGTCERIKVDNNGLCINGSLFSPTVSLDAYCSFKVGNGLGSSTGLDNIAIGQNTLCSNTTGTANVAIGCDNLRSNTIGFNNFAFGVENLCQNTTGSCNIAIGRGNLRVNTAGVGNIAVGRFSLCANSIGSDNTAIGTCSLYGNTCGVNNTAFGMKALSANTTGNLNTAIGDSAGSNNTIGSNNTFIGYNALGQTATSSNTITLGDSSISCIRAQVTTISALSDQRDKTDVENLPLGLQFILDLRPVKFTWNMRDGGKVGIKDTGFIAQEILSVEDKYNVAEYLDMVGRENPEKLEIKPGKLIPILVKAIQELHSELSQVKSELQSVKQQITGL